MSPVHVVSSAIGGAAQFVGFFLVLRELGRQRRTELGEIGRLGQLKDAILETIRNPAPVEIKVSAVASTSAVGTVTITTHGPEEPMAELRRRVGELEEQLRVAREQLSAETRNIRERVDSLVKYYDDRIAELRERRRDDIALAIKNEKRGATIFLVGVLFSLVANLVA